jgi:hypothetical protein
MNVEKGKEDVWVIPANLVGCKLSVFLVTTKALCAWTMP